MTVNSCACCHTKIISDLFSSLVLKFLSLFPLVSLKVLSMKVNVQKNWNLLMVCQ